MTNEEYNGEKLESYKAYMFCRCWCCQFIMIVAVLGIKLYFLGFYLADDGSVRVDDIGGQQVDAMSGLLKMVQEHFRSTLNPTISSTNRNFFFHLSQMDKLMNQTGVTFTGSNYCYYGDTPACAISKFDSTYKSLLKGVSDSDLSQFYANDFLYQYKLTKDTNSGQYTLEGLSKTDANSSLLSSFWWRVHDPSQTLTKAYYSGLKYTNQRVSGYLFTNVTETAETGTRLTVWQYPKTQPGDKLTQTIVDLYNAPETEYLIVSQGELYVRLALYSNQGLLSIKLGFQELFSTLKSQLPSIYSFQVQILSGNVSQPKELKRVWSSGGDNDRSKEYHNSTNFKDCQGFCYLSTLSELPKLGSQVYSLFLLLTFENDQISSSAGQYTFLLTYITWIDLISIFLVFCLICYLNLRLMSNIYYTIFSQMNLFTHTLERYSNTMLSPQDQHPISIDDLLFKEANELSDFFLEYFEVFRRNKDNNSFDMTDSIEKITSQLKKTMVYRRKFDEKIDETIRTLCEKGDFSSEFNRRLQKKQSVGFHTRAVEEVKISSPTKPAHKRNNRADNQV